MASSGETLLPIFTADAFTKEAFRGNGAAICLLRFQQVLPDDVQQKMAAELNLSETAFVSLTQEEDTFETGRRFGLRWFTPTCEVSLCGHATLASAAVLFSACGNPSPVLEFETMSGLLSARRLSDGMIELDLPAYPPSSPTAAQDYRELAKAAVGSLPIQDLVLSESGKLLVRLKDTCTRRDLESLNPRASDLLSLGPQGTRGLIVTLRGDGAPYDFVSRYFAPWLGVDEDPVTGSAHSVLTPYWSKVLNKRELRARQCSARGGDLRVRLSGEDRVAVAGHAVVVIRGHIAF